MSKQMQQLIPAEAIQCRILIIRGQKVMLDRDLALLYGPTLIFVFLALYMPNALPFGMD